jgi:hypothetical protein
MKQPSPQMVDNGTCGTISLTLYREFPAKIIKVINANTFRILKKPIKDNFFPCD